MERKLIHRAVVHWQATHSCSNHRWIAFDNERDIASLVSNLWLCVLNAASSESRWWRFTANHRTGFTDEMHKTIACNISFSPNLDHTIYTIWIISTHSWLIQRSNLMQTGHSFESNIFNESVNKVPKTGLNDSATKKLNKIEIIQKKKKKKKKYIYIYIYISS